MTYPLLDFLISISMLSSSLSASILMDSFMAMMAHSESFSTTDPSNLTDQELDCLKEAFSLFDADHDGEITVYELGK